MLKSPHNWTLQNDKLLSTVRGRGPVSWKFLHDTKCLTTQNIPEAAVIPGLVKVGAVSQRTPPPPVFSLFLWGVSLEGKTQLHKEDLKIQTV